MDPVALDRKDGARVARSIVADCCRAASMGPESADSAVLLTSELVTNAMTHGSGPVSLGVEAGREGVRVEVADDEARLPTVRPEDTSSEGGRGLSLVDALARSWGVNAQAPGKIVWFELPSQP